MKIASITLYCREDFRLDNWRKLYNDYKDEIYLHIIVNNGSLDDMSLLEERFPDSCILYSPSPNMTSSYNLGVIEAMKHSEIDAIMQITNDIRLNKGSITALYQQLIADESLAVIGPVLLKKDSDIVESFGYFIPNSYSDAIPLYRGCSYKDIKEPFKYVSSLPGGVIMIKRKAYEEFGLQDEKINMYCDERDMFIRFKGLGYREGVLCTALATHEHIFKPGTTRRSTMASYLTARNRIYIAVKYSNFATVFLLFCKLKIRNFYSTIKNLLFNRNELVDNIAVMRGLIHGLIGRMS